MVSCVSCNRESSKLNPNSNYARLSVNASDFWLVHGSLVSRYSEAEGNGRFEDFEISPLLNEMQTVDDQLVVGYEIIFGDLRQVRKYVLYAGIPKPDKHAINCDEIGSIVSNLTDPSLLALDSQRICFMKSNTDFESSKIVLEVIHGRLLLSEDKKTVQFEQINSYSQNAYYHGLPPRMLSSTLKDCVLITNQVGMNDFEITALLIEPLGEMKAHRIASYQKLIDDPSFVGANLSKDGSILVSCEFRYDSGERPTLSEIAIGVSRLKDWEVQEQHSYTWKFANWGGGGNLFSDYPIRMIGDEFAIIATPDGWVEIDLKRQMDDEKPDLILRAYNQAPKRLHKEAPPDFRGILHFENPRKLLLVQRFVDSKDAILELKESDLKKRVLKCDSSVVPKVKRR